MGDSFTAVPSAIAELGAKFITEGAQLGQTASGFGGDALQVSNAFGLLGACDGAMEKYISMAQSTVQGLEQLAQLWEQTGEQLVAEAEVYQACEQQQQQRFHGIQQTLAPAAGGGH
jgi:hypothetical protein